MPPMPPDRLRTSSEVGSTFGKGPVQKKRKLQSLRPNRSAWTLSGPVNAFSDTSKLFKLTSLPSSLGNFPAKISEASAKDEAAQYG